MIRFHDGGTAPKYPAPGCTCNIAMGIVIPDGQHIHICPVHTGVAMYGTATRC